MQLSNKKYHTILATYFSTQPNFFDSALQKKPNIRKCMEQPFQQTKAHLWDEVTDTLCDLEFIQAKACAKMTYDLVKDYNVVFEKIPDNAENIHEENKRQARMDKYTRDLIAYAKGEIKELEIPDTIPLWSEEKINTEIERMKTNPTREDRLKDFKNFLGHEAGNLQNYAHEFPHFATQQAWNWSNTGPVGTSAENLNGPFNASFLRVFDRQRPQWDSYPCVIKTLRGYCANYRALTISPNGKKAFFASELKNFIWNLESGELFELSNSNNYQIDAIAMTPDWKKAITTSRSKKCILWDLVEFKPLKVLQGHKRGVLHVDITPDGKKAISGSMDNTCIIWDLESGIPIRTLIGHTDKVTAVAISADGKIAVSGSHDNSCILWNVESGQELKRLKDKMWKVENVIITPDGKKAVVVNTGHSISVWNLVKGELSGNYNGQRIYFFSALAITPDGKKAFSGYDRLCVFWNIDNGEIFNRLKGNNSCITAVAITPDGLKAISASDDWTLILWDLSKGAQDKVNLLQKKVSKESSPLPERDKIVLHNEVINVSVFPDGKNAISTAHYDSSILWDLTTGNPIKKYSDDELEDVECFAITPDGQKRISVVYDSIFEVNQICVHYELEGSAQTEIISKFNKNHQTRIAISPTGKEILYTIGRSIFMWDSECKDRFTIQENKGIYRFDDINSIAFSPDGIIALNDSTKIECNLMNLRSRKLLATLYGHTDSITNIAISPDGRRAITASVDKSCIVWDIRCGKPISILMGHNRSVRAVAFLPNGKNAISVSWDKTCIIWDLDNDKKSSIYISDSELNTISIFPKGFIVGKKTGDLTFLQLNKEHFGNEPCIITITKIWDTESNKYMNPTARCPSCWDQFAPDVKIINLINGIIQRYSIGTLDSPCLKLPDEAWEDPGLLGICPKCGGELKFNPFVAGGDY